MSLQLQDGAVFASRYKVVRRIALGGMGAVYEVEHTETLRRLALKVMLPHIVQSADMRERFRREAQVAAHIESEHIVGVFDAGIDDATSMPFMVMELLRGEELAQALKRVGRFGPMQVVTFLHQAALALEKTHRALIVHRDLKPENLFLTTREDGQPRIKVLDFGIAKLVAEGTTNAPGTQSLGTPLFMAPEQFRSGYPVSPATDIYALGMIAFNLLVGVSYWAPEAADSSNVFAFAGAVMAGPRELATVRARKKGVNLPASFDAWFSRATAIAPGDRFPGALAAISALSEALGMGQLAGAASSGAMQPSAFGLPAAQPQPPPSPPAAADAEAAPTQVYLGSGSGPQPGFAPPPGAHALSGSGPQGLSGSGPQGFAGSGAQFAMGGDPPHPPPQAVGAGGLSASGPQVVTGSGYGTTAAAVSRPVGTGKVVAAVALGLVLGVGGLAFMFLRAGGPAEAPKSAATTASASAAPPPAAVTASAEAAPAPPPTAASTASATATATASAAAAAPATKPAAPPVDAPRPPTPPAAGRKATAPAEPAKKSIFVRD